MDIIESPGQELLWAGTERDSAGGGAHRAHLRALPLLNLEARYTGLSFVIL